VTAYEYGSEPKRLELPNPYRLQNRLLWLCGALLVAAGVVSLLWAKSAMQENALRLAAAPIVAGLLLRHFDVAAPWQANRYSLAGDSAILAFVATFCFQAASRLWGRFNFVVLTWVEMMGNYPTSRIGTGNNFSSRVNTENNVVRTEAMTLRVWRARTESVVFGKDDARQITAMFTTEQEARALTAELMQFARSQSVLVAPFSGEDEQRMAALGAGERGDARRQRRNCTANCKPRQRSLRPPVGRRERRGACAFARPAAPPRRPGRASARTVRRRCRRDIQVDRS